VTIIYHRRVPPEVYEACDYYDAQSAGLGDQFFEELAALMNKIAEHPRRWPPLKAGDPRRKALLDRFPYAVVYEERANFIKVLIVRHHARRPGYGERRK